MSSAMTRQLSWCGMDPYRPADDGELLLLLVVLVELTSLVVSLVVSS